MDEKDNRKYSICIYGTTGTTGKLISEYLLTRYIISDCLFNDVNFDIAFSGRNKDKMEKVIKDIIKSINDNIKSKNPSGLYKEAYLKEETKEDDDELLKRLENYKPNIIIADCSDIKTILNMTKLCNTLINATGPYRKYGEIVLKSCIDTNTHYTDITGEPEFMEDMYLKYNRIAKKKRFENC